MAAAGRDPARDHRVAVSEATARQHVDRCNRAVASGDWLPLVVRFDG